MVLICSDYVYGLVNMDPEIAENYVISRLIACGLILVIGLLNMISARVGSRVSDVFTVLKMGALILIIGVGVYFLSTGHVDNFKNAFQTHEFIRDE